MLESRLTTPPERNFTERVFDIFIIIFLLTLSWVFWGLGKINDIIFGPMVRFLKQFEIQKHPKKCHPPPPPQSPWRWSYRKDFYVHDKKKTQKFLKGLITPPLNKGVSDFFWRVFLLSNWMNCSKDPGTEKNKIFAIFSKSFHGSYNVI